MMTRRQRIACLLWEARRETQMFLEEQHTATEKSFALALIIGIETIAKRVLYEIAVPSSAVNLYSKPMPMPRLNGGGDGY
jgi:hypothetical protein